MDITPTLSIITVNLNNYDGLKRTIESVICQTFTDYEWIVIDGGSTDSSRELIEQYADHFAYWCSEPDNGIYNAMNKGIALANGKWLQFLNSGDWLHEKNVLSNIFSKDYTAKILYGDFVISYGEKVENVSPPEILTLNYLFQYHLCHQSLFFNRDLQIKYDESFKIAADWALCWSLFLNNISFQKIPHSIVYYDANGISKIFQEKCIEEKNRAFEALTPNNIKNDILELYSIHKEWDFILKRKSLRMYLSRFKKNAQLLYKALIKYDALKTSIIKAIKKTT